MHKLLGVGLLNIYLHNGFQIEGEGEEQTIAYKNLDGLYDAIARAIAIRSITLTGPELRFMRKRLGMTQQEIGALGGKSGQVAAKWEKGSLPVPLAEGKLIRLAWLTKYSRVDLFAAVRQLLHDSTLTGWSERCDYVFSFDGQRWVEDRIYAHVTAQAQARAITNQAIIKAMKANVSYTGGAVVRNVVVKSMNENKTAGLT